MEKLEAKTESNTNTINNIENIINNFNENDLEKFTMLNTLKLINQTQNNSINGNDVSDNLEEEEIWLLLNAGEQRHYRELNCLGITIENSWQFRDEYIKSEWITKYSSIRFLKEINHDTERRLFWNLYPKIENKLNNRNDYDHYEGPLSLYDGLLLNALKDRLWEPQFQTLILCLVDNWLLNTFSLENIVKSNTINNSLHEYMKLCIFLRKRGIYESPDLKWMTPNEYFDTIKLLDNENILDDLVKKHCYGEITWSYLWSTSFFENYIPKCLLLHKNNVPMSAIQYFWENYRDSYEFMKEIFDNKIWSELYLFLSKYPQKLENLGWKEIKEIELTAKPWWYNFCFRWILEMIKSMWKIEIPILWKNSTESEEQKRKNNREAIVKWYENILRNYISMDKDENWNERPREKTFDKIFFASAKDNYNEDRNWAFQWEYNMEDVIKNFTNSFEDCSSIVDNDWNLDNSNQKNMIKKIKSYMNDPKHTNEKVLIFLWYHGGEDWSSTNGRSKEDRQELAKISPNIKIIGNRCYFWRAYSNDLNEWNNIYSIQSPVSWSSNDTEWYSNFVAEMREWFNKGLWFHELEIYTRLHYYGAFTPLTDFVDYADFNTWEKKYWKIWLADAWNGKQSNNDVYYW